jgi:hypothetical protein
MKTFHPAGVRGAAEIMSLEPPPTPEELRWWNSVRPRYRNRSMLRTGGPFFLVWIGVALISNPAKLFTPTALWFIPAMSLLSVGAAWLQYRTTEKHQRDQELRWKRIRESIAATSAESDAPPVSAISRTNTAR